MWSSMYTYTVVCGLVYPEVIIAFLWKPCILVLSVDEYLLDMLQIHVTASPQHGRAVKLRSEGVVTLSTRLGL